MGCSLNSYLQFFFSYLLNLVSSAKARAVVWEYVSVSHFLVTLKKIIRFLKTSSCEKLSLSHLKASCPLVGPQVPRQPFRWDANVEDFNCKDLLIPYHDSTSRSRLDAPLHQHRSVCDKYWIRGNIILYFGAKRLQGRKTMLYKQSLLNKRSPQKQ